LGVGYRVEMRGKDLVFHLGYSHPVEFPLPEGVTAKLPDPKQPKVVLRSADKELLGLTAARIRALRSPEPYKGKGIKYATETIRRKVGKSGAK
jgi:large subunit ribosomal protein L6